LRKRQQALDVDAHFAKAFMGAGGGNAPGGVLVPLADGKGIAQGLAQGNHMAEQAQSAQDILIAHAQAQPLVGQYLERALNHRDGLAIGNTLGRVIQVSQGKAQATAQRFGIRALLRYHVPKGLQQEWRHQRQFKLRVNGFPLHGSGVPD
jgi:hypothetical protein